ncbi:MAG: MBL fold metallo-hydrolase [Bacteroidetes bacterium]|nr:MAG: MBL fold metallo-hydrolase [Bacteroidota bacterium]
MKIEQIYTGCLAQGAYYIVSGNEAAIIDPLREIQPYIERAEKDGVTIKYVLETHFHADFVSGHIDLAKATGAKIVYGPTAKPAFDAYVATDGEELTLGKVRIEVLHTPGHTMESSCFLLKDENGTPNALFTGDTLFIGDVGRPDLAQKAANLTKEELAGLLYESLRTKVMNLPDEVIVYPAHGAGSACGKNMSKETVSTIGAQKQTNYALRATMTKEEFVKEVTDGLLPPPVYFPQNARMNKEGYEAINKVLQRGQSALSVAAFEAAANETGALIIDTRNPEDFVSGFIPNSINIGINGNFAPWVGALITDVKQPLLLVCEPGREEEVVTRLARVGYDNVLGYLKGGFEAWRAEGKETDEIETISAFEFAHRQSLQPMPIVDVRKTGEYEAEHVINALNIPLDYISENMAGFPQNETFYLHCAGGYRSVIAASILKARGYANMINVEGGFTAIKETPIARTAYVCPTASK